MQQKGDSASAGLKHFWQTSSPDDNMISISIPWNNSTEQDQLAASMYPSTDLQTPKTQKHINIYFHSSKMKISLKTPRMFIYNFYPIFLKPTGKSTSDKWHLQQFRKCTSVIYVLLKIHHPSCQWHAPWSKCTVVTPLFPSYLLRGTVLSISKTLAVDSLHMHGKTLSCDQPWLNRRGWGSRKKWWNVNRWGS